MRALVLSEYKHLEVRDVPDPAVGESDVLVRLRACGICGSDALVTGTSRGLGQVLAAGAAGPLEGAVVLLASDASAYITGQTLLVDGGISTGAIRALPRKP